MTTDFKTLSNGAVIVAILKHGDDGSFLIATAHQIYIAREGKLNVVHFEVAEDWKPL
jgi:hypothetical protein